MNTRSSDRTNRVFLLCLGLCLPAWPAFGQTPPSVRFQPTDQSISLGAAAEFQVTAAGSRPLSYQWRRDGAVIDGATDRTFLVANAQPTHAGGYDVVVTNLHGAITSQVAVLTVDPTFTKITSGSIVTDAAGSTRVAWLDWNNDGYPDAFFGNPSQDALYQGSADGAFTKLSTGATIGSALSFGGYAADYDNDGWEDLFVVKWGGGANQLFRNTLGTDFIAVDAVEAGSIVTDRHNWVSAGWADYNRDGFLDLFVGNRTTENDFLYRGNSDGMFSAMPSSEVGDVVQDQGWTEACAWADYNNDGWPDLWVVNFDWVNDGSKGENTLYRNDRGVFSRISQGSIATIRSSGSAAWGDYNNDGFLDLFLTDFWGTNSLHQNSQGETFTDVGEEAGVASPMVSWAATWGDYDNDGLLDLFVAAYSEGSSVLYHNDGDGSFSMVDVGSPLRDGVNRSGVTLADYNNDGFLDLCIVCGDGVPAQNLLYRNNGNANHWLKCRLIGSASNRSAVGAKVRVKAEIGEESVWQLREVGAGGSGGGGSPRVVHFGLGDATSVDVIRIEWPSGTVQELNDVAADQILNVTEPARLIPNTAGGFEIRSWINQSFDVEASTNLTTWTMTATVTNLTGTLIYQDENMGLHDCQYYRVVAN